MLTSDYRKPHPLNPHDVPEKASNKGKRKELVELRDVVLSDFSPTPERRFATHDAFPNQEPVTFWDYCMRPWELGSA